MQIASIVYEWAHVEGALTFLLSSAMGKVDRVGASTVQPDWISHQVMETLESLRTRLDVISAVLVPHLTDDLLERWSGPLRDGNRLAGISRQVRKASMRRNIAVHSAWSVSDLFPSDLIRSETDGTVSRYTASDFAEIHQQVLHAAG